MKTPLNITHIGQTLNLVHDMSFVGKPPSFVRECKVLRFTKNYVWVTSRSGIREDKYHITGAAIGLGFSMYYLQMP